MILFQNFLLAFIIPMALPILSAVLEKEEKSKKVILNEDGSTSYEKQLKIIWLEMPGAFLANSIWNATLIIKKENLEEIYFWNFTLFVLVIFQVIQFAHSKLEPKRNYFIFHIILMGVIVFFLTIIKLIKI
ncbi:hypothetical protein [Leptospira biflexa]|nr:hypothetical protein [Leptospira biflexa]